MIRFGSAVVVATVLAFASAAVSSAKPVREAPAGEPPRYVVEFLPNPNVPDEPLHPNAINNSGEMTGWVDWPYDAWIDRPGRGTERRQDLPGRTHGAGWDINERGDVAGTSGFETIEPPERAVLWTQARRPIDLGTLGTDSRAFGLNNHSDVVGLSYVGGMSHAFLWRPGLGMVDLTPDSPFSAAYEISDRGQVVGELGNGRAFRWTAGVREQLDPPAGYAYSSAMAINERGQVAGNVETASGNSEKFARWTDGIGWEILGGSGQHNMFWGINERGDMVGIGTSGNFRVGYVYLEGHGLFPLRTLLTEDWIVMGAYDINDNGVIAAHVSATDGSPRIGAARLHPVP